MIKLYTILSMNWKDDGSTSTICIWIGHFFFLLFLPFLVYLTVQITIHTKNILVNSIFQNKINGFYSLLLLLVEVNSYITIIWLYMVRINDKMNWSLFLHRNECNITRLIFENIFVAHLYIVIFLRRHLVKYSGAHYITRKLFLN